jgi:hypothetical protein
MKRRNFVVASGSTVLSGLATSQIQRPAIGLDFEISTPDKDPSEVDSLVIEFETLEITPKYLDEKEPVNVQAKVEVEDQTKKSNELQTLVKNGQKKDLKNDIDSIVVDGLNVSSTITGDVTVSINHPDMQDSYSRQFYVNGSEIPGSEKLHSRYDFSELENGTTSNLPDLTGNGYDLTKGSFSGVGVSINGVQSGEFDGDNDGVWTDRFTAVSQPITLFAVVDLNVGSSRQYTVLSLTDTTDEQSIAFQYDDVNDIYKCNFGNPTDCGGSQGISLLTLVVDGSNSIFRFNGTETSLNDVGTESMRAIGIGSRNPRNDTRFWKDTIGEVLIYPDRRTSQQISDVESYLSKKWNLTI